MGCDIHLFTEINKGEKGEEKWVNNDCWKHNPYYNPEDPDGEEPMEHVSIYNGRNYDLFGILANVRNYSENGCIDDPRGLPDNVSWITKKEADRWKGDAHNHSWFTLKELKDYYQKNGRMKRSGMVSPESAKLLDEGKETPNTWAGWTDPSMGWVFREWEEVSSLYYLVLKLDKACRDEFWIRQNDDLSDRYDAEKSYRIVFWFDN